MAATRPVASGLTLEEFLKLPEEKPYLEFIDGVVQQKVAPQAEHSVLQGQLLTLLNNQIRPRHLGRAFAELRFTTGEEAYVPDVSAFRQDRITRTPSGRISSRFPGPPDIAIEVRSPGQSIRDLTRRCESFVNLGVRVVLLVDDRDETIRVFRPGHDMHIARGDEPIHLNEVGPDVTLVPSEIFAELMVD